MPLVKSVMFRAARKLRIDMDVFVSNISDQRVYPVIHYSKLDRYVIMVYHKNDFLRERERGMHHGDILVEDHRSCIAS